MAGILSVSRANLAQRRQKLRRQRQMKILKAIWRTTAVTGFASALFWVAIQPIWVLKDSAQIVIKSGDHLVKQEDIKAMLGLSSPQSLWRVEPTIIADTLRKQPNVAEATVTRRLLPPSLMIEIQERIPVAIAQVSQDQTVINCLIRARSNPKSCLQNRQGTNKQNQLGLLDAYGVWMPIDNYASTNLQPKLPQMIVIGSPAQYKTFWNQLYAAISQSSVKVTEINCQDPTNLILKTELGNVHLGSPNNQLLAKMQTLAQMRHLRTQVNLSNMDYIDLKNPATPLVQVNQPKSAVDNRKSQPSQKKQTQSQ
ncbi:MAG: cell division protein FtsQ/DivIB [Cuspidothrix sp.]